MEFTEVESGTFEAQRPGEGVFFMQSAAFLAYQRTMEKGHGRSNCRTLFGIGRIPSDNYIRDFLDEADPALLQPCFERMEALLSEPPMRQAFGRLGGRTLIALDGTEFFCSQKLGCPHCLTRKRANGKTESYHSMLSATVVTPMIEYPESTWICWPLNRP